MWWHTCRNPISSFCETDESISIGGSQFSRLLAAKVCASAVVMLDTPRSEVVWRVLTTHSIRQFPLHLPSRLSPSAIRFQLDSITESYSRSPDLSSFSEDWLKYLRFSWFSSVFSSISLAYCVKLATCLSCDGLPYHSRATPQPVSSVVSVFLE
jgi:hypothetical protein